MFSLRRLCLGSFAAYFAAISAIGSGLHLLPHCEHAPAVTGHCHATHCCAAHASQAKIPAHRHHAADSGTPHWSSGQLTHCGDECAICQYVGQAQQQTAPWVVLSTAWVHPAEPRLSVWEPAAPPAARYLSRAPPC